MSGPLERAQARFRAAFGADAGVTSAWRAPGRVNLIGEHVDYSGGLVLPVAIDRDTVAVARGRSDGRLRVASDDRPETATIELDSEASPAGAWYDYAVGVARALRERGIAVAGADLAVASDVPLGAGLSSSAALELSVAGVLATLAGAAPDRRLLAAACTSAENAYVGVRSGSMDQLISALGVRDHALLIDCATAETTPIPIPGDFAFVVADSGVRHALAGSAYNDRRRESDLAAAELGNLRHATPAAAEALDDPVLRRRARHIISENARVSAFAAALRAADAAAAGVLMNASHESLRVDYEVSVPEVDALVASVRAEPGVLGARMTGGGFGGSIVVLVEAAHAAQLVRTLDDRAARAQRVIPSDGATRLV